MKRRLYTLIISTLIMIFVLSLASCGADEIHIKDYPAIGNEYQYALDESVPFVTLDNAPTTNESRGFRGETYINLGMNEAYPGSGHDAREELISSVERYKADDMRLMQVYVYIGKFYDSNIDDDAFLELREYLELARSLDIKILLRFAYETGSSKHGPRTQNILGHLEQIKAFMSDNIELVNSTIYAVQMGLIGLWGEGHGAKHNIDVGKVASGLAGAIPEDIPLMVRTPEMLTKIDDSIEHRFGVHDDFLVGYDHEWGMMDWTSPEYTKLLNKCKYTVTDAEMPWAKAGYDIDTLGVVKQCRDYGLTSLSIEHNYIEEGGEHALYKWKSEYLTRDMLEENRLPYNPHLLVEDKISIYDYLKHHLGYQLVASNVSIQDNECTFMLTNFGFAKPYNYDMEVYIDGKRVDVTFDTDKLVQFGQAIYTVPYSGGKVEVKLVNKRDTSDTIRLYNDIDYIDGKNIIAS